MKIPCLSFIQDKSHILYCIRIEMVELLIVTFGQIPCHNMKVVKIVCTDFLRFNLTLHFAFQLDIRFK